MGETLGMIQCFHASCQQNKPDAGTDSVDFSAVDVNIRRLLYHCVGVTSTSTLRGKHQGYHVKTAERWARRCKQGQQDGTKTLVSEVGAGSDCLRTVVHKGVAAFTGATTP